MNGRGPLGHVLLPTAPDPVGAAGRILGECYEW